MQAIICPGHTRPIVDLQFSDIVGDKKHYFLISACKDGKPMLRLGSTGDWIGTYEGHKGAVMCAGLDSTAQLAATGSADFSAKVWDAMKGSMLATFTHDHVVRALDLGSLHADPFSCKADNATPSHLLTATNAKAVCLWDISRPDACVSKLTGHSGSIRKVIWLPDGHRCFSVAEDKDLRVWDLRSGECTETVSMEEAGTDADVSWHHRHCLLARGSRALELDLTQSNLGAALASTNGGAVPLPPGTLTACRYPAHLQTADTQRIFVCGGTDNTVYKCSLDTGEVLEKYTKVHCGAINCIRFSPDGHLYATASDDGTLRLFQTSVGESYGLWRRVETAVATSGAPAPSETSNHADHINETIVEMTPTTENEAHNNV